MLKRAQGFTLIELVLALSILGILAALVPSAYQDYVKRAQISEAMLLTVNVRLAIAGYYAYHGKLPVNNRQTGVLQPKQLLGRYVAAIVVEDGNIRVKFVDYLVAGTLDFTPVIARDYPARIYWTCSSNTIPNKYLPGNCRS